MTTTEILKKVRKIEIKTKGLTNHIFGGEYHSAFKGRGMSFSEVREYNYGDDVRNIDWNVTARFNNPYIKIFEEERELIVMLLVDISTSTLFGTQKQSKRDLITELCAVLSFSGIKNNDKVGVIFFSDKIEKYIPPQKGKSHILFIIRELITIDTHQNAKTNIATALTFLNTVMKKKAITFLMSDFISIDYKKFLQIASKKHDIIGVHITDSCDSVIADIGVIQIEDFETKEKKWVNTSSKTFQKTYINQFEKIKNTTNEVFSQSGATLINISTDDDYVKKLKLFFKSRSSHVR